MAKPKHAPYLAIKTDVRKDDRFEVLGDIAGYNKYEAFGRMCHLWAWCRDRKLADAPEGADSYVVPEDVVIRFLGERGVKAILAADVDTFALGQRHPMGILLRGTSETVAALRQRIGAASAGGMARAGTVSAGSRVSGRYPNASRDCAENQPTAPEKPAEAVPNTSLPPSSLLLPPEEERVSGKPDVPSLPGIRTDPVAIFAEAAVAEINRLSGKRYEPNSKAVLGLCKALVKAKHTPDQARQVIASKRSWIGDPKMGDNFRPSTLLAAKNFANYLDDIRAGQSSASPSQPRYIQPANDDNEPDLTYSPVSLMGDA